jgi:hypothetical protein
MYIGMLPSFTTEGINKLSNSRDTFRQSARKQDRGLFIRFPDDLRDRIDEECKLLSITRNAWITMVLDKELREAYKERALRLGIKDYINHLSPEDFSPEE